MDYNACLTKGGVEEARCKLCCPAGIDVPRYVRKIREERFSEAARVIRERTPFAGVLAYVCPGFCELGCRRSEVDEPLAINALKRFALEREEMEVLQIPKASTNRRVAVVGSGPAGLTAAYHLSNVCGHKVTVFEASSVAGGMMRLGIPEYRLPDKVLSHDIDLIKMAGVDIKTNTFVKSIDSLLEKDFDAIFVSVGAWNSIRLNIQGEGADTIIDGLSVLKEVNLGAKYNFGETVAVIGGGNVAVDVARVARRQGAKKVFILYRRTRDEMPCKQDEIEQALEEGIQTHFLVVPSKVEKKNESLSLELVRMKLGGVDESGRRRPESIPGSEFTMEFDRVIAAIGEIPEIPAGFGIKTVKDGSILVDPLKLSTSKRAVFAGGDCVNGPSTVIEAIAAGRKAAINIDKYLGGKGIIDKKSSLKSETIAKSWNEGILAIPRQRMALVDSKERLLSFNCVELGFNEEMATKEANRCLSCDLTLPITIDASKCVECFQCQTICSLVYQHACNPEKARIIVDAKKGIHFNMECIGGCSLCLRNCLVQAISVNNNVGMCIGESLTKE